MRRRQRQKSLEELAEDRVRGAACGIAMLLWVPLQVLQVGPAHWIAQLQLRFIGAYYPILSFAIGGVGLGLALHAVGKKIPRLRAALVRLASIPPRFARHAIVAVCLVMTLLAIRIVLREWLSPELGPMTVDEAVHQRPQSFFATIRGRVAEAPFWISSGRSKEKKYFIPFREPGEQGETVRLMITGSERELAGLQLLEPSTREVVLTGFVDDDISAGDTQWFRDGMGLEVSGSLRILHPGHQPGKAPLGECIFIVVVGLLIGARMHFWMRRMEKVQEHAEQSALRAEQGPAPQASLPRAGEGDGLRPASSRVSPLLRRD